MVAVKLTCAAFVALLLAVAAPAAADVVYDVTLSGNSRPSNYLVDSIVQRRGVHVTQGFCEKLCEAMLLCNGYYYTTDNLGNVCYPMPFFGPSEPAAYSGVAVSRNVVTSTTVASTTVKNTLDYDLLYAGNTRPANYLSGSISRVEGLSIQACEALCNQQDDCVAYYYTTNHNNVHICRTLNGIAPAIAGPFDGRTYLVSGYVAPTTSITTTAAPTTTTTTTTSTAVPSSTTVIHTSSTHPSPTTSTTLAPGSGSAVSTMTTTATTTAAPATGSAGSTMAPVTTTTTAAPATGSAGSTVAPVTTTTTAAPATGSAGSTVAPTTTTTTAAAPATSSAGPTVAPTTTTTTAAAGSTVAPTTTATTTAPSPP